MAEILERNGVVFDFSKVRTMTYFAYCSNIKHFPELDFSSAQAITGSFEHCPNLETIDKLVYSSDGSQIPHSYYESPKLANIVIEGVIGKSFDLSTNTALTHDSLMSFINALKDYSADTSGTTYKLSMGSTNIAKLTEDELNIIKSKGWTYA